MREIEFRAWCKKQKEMRYDIHLSKYFYEFIEFTNDYEIMQYTGLKDKNGTKIFEGDIFAWGSTLYQVIYADFGFKVNYVKDHNDIYLYDFQLNYFEENDEIEVIGNIYEDDDLLE